MEEKIRRLVDENDLCVLATAEKGEPHCSLMSYAASEDGREIYLATDRNTKKFKNIESNPRVSLLIDSRRAEGGEVAALTVFGLCKEVKDEGEARRIAALLAERHPRLRALLAREGTAVMRVEVESFQLLEGLDEKTYLRLG
ncbi:MAG TPA: pyridoxamine 5'-phosphate oxidase family protein [Syntrophales bacterium]|nr:pyridoxamine 5'-phosphate oxidase family protein [Syntrophales bacterium]HRV43424.1 pyridoxamine 5'-phosphate oxidase family protein [Syntrophales bacterium]